jgi:replicative DNA helicase
MGRGNPREKERYVLVQGEPLYNPEAEMAVLGSILIDSECLKKVREIITNEDFYEHANKYIFRAMEELQDEGIEVDLLVLADKLRDEMLLDVIGGASYLAEMTNYVPTSTRVLNYAKIVAEDSGKRQVDKAFDEVSRATKSGASLDEVLEKVKEQVHEVNQINGKKNKYQVSSMMDYVDASKERYKNWGKLQGLSTGFPSIDEQTLGMVDGELIIVAGPTSRGKTLLAMSISNNVAKYGGRVLFVTLEMTKEELTSRYMYVNGGWGTEEFALVSANTIFQDNDELDWKDIDGLIQNAKEQLDVDLVVIDHLHYFARDIKNASEELGKITMTFKKNAIRHKVPIILISHIRKLGKDEDLSGESLRGSSLIAQDSDIVLLVNRDPETNAMGILIDKNRNRGKISDRTKDWGGRTERELNTVYLDFNNTKLQDRKDIHKNIKELFPGAELVPQNK